MHVTVLSGPSGSGKTRMRALHPDLKHLPYVDIADVHRAHPDYDWPLAMQEFLRRTREALRQHRLVVLEGYSLPGSPSLRLLIDALKAASITYEIISLWAPPDIGQARLEAALHNGEISPAEYALRSRTLHAVVSQQGP
jgi:hypothetical protein